MPVIRIPVATTSDEMQDVRMCNVSEILAIWIVSAIHALSHGRPGVIIKASP